MGLVGIVPQTQLALVKLHTPLMSALAFSADRVRSGQADTALQRWFGDVTPAWKKEVETTLRKWRSNINVRSIRVGFATLDDRGSNAAAYAARTLDFSKKLAGTGADDNMNLDTGFSSLPEYLPRMPDGTVDASGWNQSKFETIVHELSHLFLNTTDVVLRADADGNPTKEAYGAKRAAKLAANNPAAAKTNAENWGIFVEAVGVHKSS